jgi:hypothetical protein
MEQDGKRGTGVGERVERVADEGTVAGRSNCNLCGPREGTLQYDLTGKCDKRWNEQKRKDNHRRRDDRTRTRPSGPVRCAASGHRVRGSPVVRVVSGIQVEGEGWIRKNSRHGIVPIG